MNHIIVLEDRKSVQFGTFKSFLNFFDDIKSKLVKFCINRKEMIYIFRTIHMYRLTTFVYFSYQFFIINCKYDFRKCCIKPCMSHNKVLVKIHIKY